MAATSQIPEIYRKAPKAKGASLKQKDSIWVLQTGQADVFYYTSQEVGMVVVNMRYKIHILLPLTADHNYCCLFKNS